MDAPRHDLAALDTDTWLARVAEAGPVVEALAPEADRARRLSDAAMAALHDQGLFRLLLPIAYGGAEMTLPVFLPVVEAIARHDGSAAWCVAQGNGCASLAGFLEPALAQEIWGRDPSAVLAWGPGKAEARAVDGGYAVTARTNFASGSHHATWIAAHCTGLEADGTPRRDSRGEPEIRTVLVPAGTVTLSDGWDAVGLRGTGSDGFACDGLFVPEERTIVRATMIDDRPAISSLHGMPLMSVYAIGFAAVALGIARGLFDAFVALAQEKRPRGARFTLKENPAVHEEVARADARIRGARAFLVEAAEAGAADLAEAGRMSVDTLMTIRLAGTHAIGEAKAATGPLFDTAGTSAVMASSPFERRFRDIHAVALQMQARKTHLQTWGSWALGGTVTSDGVNVG
ncbi:MAG: acyl-CoA dehydrogenase family protein [Defluviicoccus sp.]|nr:acyl-CoA dehydrogenase family protein [Defluviicoccus sp.]MDE0383083.1 acyl-CoA dehydrogenase family protein [Defluviicoccus sp.]